MYVRAIRLPCRISAINSATSVMPRTPELLQVKTLALFALIFMMPDIGNAGTEADSGADEAVYYVLRYTPGEHWAEGMPYDEQPGIAAHFEYLDKLFQERRLVMGGRLREEATGLMILRTGSLQEAREVAENDPGVVEGLVDAAVNTWDVRMSSMRWSKRRAPPAIQDPDEPWHLKRIDPSAPINLEDKP